MWPLKNASRKSKSYCCVHSDDHLKFNKSLQIIFHFDTTMILVPVSLFDNIHNRGTIHSCALFSSQIHLRKWIRFLFYGSIITAHASTLLNEISMSYELEWIRRFRLQWRRIWEHFRLKI
jgi:hypothetical protein